MASFKIVYLFILLPFINLITVKVSSDYCSENLTTPNSAFQKNLRTLLSYLSSNATANKQFYNTTVAGRNHNSDTVYGMFFCFGDVPPQLCSECVAETTKAILSGSYGNCSLSTDADLQNKDCMIRYSNSSFFSTPDLTSYGSSCIYLDGSNQKNLTSLVSKTINEVADEAAKSSMGAKKYATKQERLYGLQTLYCEAQCTPYLSPHDCRKCLNASITLGQSCKDLSKSEGSECRINCDTYPFYYRSSTAPPPTQLVPVTNSSGTDSQHLAYIFHNCSTNQTVITTDRVSLSNLISLLSSKSTTKTFFNSTVDMLSGLFMCRGDLSPTLCHLCVQNAAQRISSDCPSSNEAIIWYNHCLLRYSSNISSLSTQDTIPVYKDLNIVDYTSKPNQLQSFFTWTLANTLFELSYGIRGSSGTIKNYETKTAQLNANQTLYTLAQCSPDISDSDCSSCLEKILRNEIPWCCMASPEGKVLSPSCYMMFGLSQFYRNDDDEGEPHSSSATAAKTIIILIVVLVTVSALLLSICCYFRRRKTRKSNFKTLLKKNFGEESTTLEGLLFDLSTIKAATNDFSFQNKIGKGGFGEVYKGILCDGRHIAVKRLSTNSKQGSVEFGNEILLIAKLQHKNLVTFIGFCLEDQEKVLIYEYMPNGSLDYHLFDNTKHQKLNWLERYKIIEGIAMGILYLHEYSRLKVIHRDLKPSNVLLDENMNPKISDFGMARIVEIDQDHASTNRIVGTYGYMSPEYAMFGQFSEKSDVFSFGVMILEVITGKKSVNVYESHNVAEGLMGYVWKRWKDQEPLNILDSSIKESYSQMEVLKCIHIGLLCVQENQNVRPTMAMVISYLNNHSLELPSPQEPAFFLQKHRMNQETVMQQKSSSSQGASNSTLFSVNQMSASYFYPR